MSSQTDSLVSAIVFDWAGTTVDFGSRAPMGAFVEAFAEFGVEISVEEARAPMGLPKRDHIKALGAMPRVAEAWKDARGAEFGEHDIDALYEVFVPLNVEVVGRHADVIPGVVESVQALRARGIKIGSTTGYVREIMEPLVPKAAEQGYAPDNLVCAGDLSQGRPTAMMMYRCFLDLDVWPAASVVKVDDTEPGIAEGLAAGCWTVGIAMTGNQVGLSQEELDALPPAERAARQDKAVATLTRSGAHFVIDGVGDLLPVIDEIEGRLRRGERP